MTTPILPYNHSYPFQFGVMPSSLQWEPYYGRLWPNRQQRQEVANLFIPPNWTENPVWKQNFLDYSA